MQTRKNLNNCKGFTLIEAMMATVLLGAAALGLLIPFTSGAQAQAEGKRKVLATKLASDLVEEILVEDFNLITTSYDGYSESQGNLIDLQGQTITDPAYANFSRECSCQAVYMPAESTSEPKQFILVEVTVKYSGREMAVLKRLITD